MMKQTRCYRCDKPIEAEWLPEGGVIICDECLSYTDELSVEKLQEIRVEELKDFNSKILQAELENQKLQKEIDAAKKYIEESYKADKEDNKLLDLIIEAVAKLKSDNKTLKKYIEHVIGTIKHDGHLGTIQTDWILPDLEKALAEIGGDDEL
ncbi:hypothetical protein [Lactococcus lactis]|nr:hypothetical protein [Lactococcus lactis]ARE11642.1 hypothetical protein LLUC063_1833 [Lactococcus lactis subsp. lactis]UPG97419.1 hypothetical protein MXM90_09530 [Lactococcus lactis]URL08351.1 hypothetical protein L1704_09605 [Lactococcus lactis subsp. lactis]